MMLLDLFDKDGGSEPCIHQIHAHGDVHHDQRFDILEQALFE
jgi:hypothetical protein